MFGESESESPRVGSPWDSFIAGPSPSPLPCPKLVPEVEYGNVEYKLKLLNPSPERFTRLVTQMKWRLLEGGGQAYYELGVADSGQLVGLPRRDLEQSLETLEMMAGEIGASVIVVKEIEVPAALIGRGMNSALGIPQRTPGPSIVEGEADTSTSATEEDDVLALDTDADVDADADIVAYRQTLFTTRTHPERPASQSSPAILATDDDDDDTLFHLDIASVYKPRPHRARPPAPTAAQSKYTKRGTPPRRLQQRNVNMDPVARAVEKRIKRDARRDQRRRALLADPVVQDTHVELEFVLNDELDTSTADTISVTSQPPEQRLIVEALVVRKLALEEAFLDFGGFALEL